MNRNMWKKLAALIMALAMLLSCAAIAAELTEDEVSEAVETVDTNESEANEEPQNISDLLEPAPLLPPDATVNGEDDGEDVALISKTAPTDGVSAPTSTVEVTVSPAPETAEPGIYYGKCIYDDETTTDGDAQKIAPTYVPADGSDAKVYHKVITATMQAYKCEDKTHHYHENDIAMWTEVTTEVVYEPHVFDGDTCTECDYVCEDHEYVDGVCKYCETECEHESWDTSDVSVHKCNECGISEEHTWEYVDETNHECSVCKKMVEHTCSSPETEYTATEDSEYKDEGSDNYHALTNATLTEVYYCDYCGEQYKTETKEDQEGTEPHTYKDGVCTLCEHECQHIGDGSGEAEDPYTVETKTVVKSCVSNGASGHTVTVNKHTVTTCDICGEQISDVAAKSDTTYTEAHTFKNNVCTKCGYEYVPEFVEVPANEPVHGVAVVDELRMGVALAKAMANLTFEYGKDALVEIVGADTLLTAEEREALNELIPAERVLVLVQVLGCGDEQNQAITELELTLSPEAEELLAAIQARLDAMDEAAAAEFAQLQQEYFPVVNNQIQITIKVNANGEQQERYTFTSINDAWMFTKLEIAK